MADNSKSDSASSKQRLERRAEIGRERRDKTRQSFLLSAAKLVASRDTEGLSIGDFVKAAGVARGTFYNYFESKEEILTELWKHLGSTTLEDIREAHGDNDDPAYRLSSGLRIVVRKAAQDHTWGWLMFRFATAAPGPTEHMRSFPLRDIRVGIEQKRFKIGDAELACDYFVGVTTLAVKAVLTSERGADYAEQSAFLMLRGLGLTDKDAYDIANLALPTYPLS